MKNQKKKGFVLGNNVLLLIYVIMAIISGTANRVSFRLMQYAMGNYSYFLSQLTTFAYLPVNFTIILIKLLLTNNITDEMTRFPKWKFIVMGIFDSLSGLLMVVAGVFVPGIMQNLLIQGVVPVTMLFSVLLLRYTGDRISRIARAVLQRKGIEFEEHYVGDIAVEQVKAEGDPKRSPCRILVNGNEKGRPDLILQDETPPDEDIFARMCEWIGFCKPEGAQSLENVNFFSGVSQDELHGQKVTLLTDAHTWGLHIRKYYSIFQYVGAIIILGGLVVSVWPALTKNSGSDNSSIGWYLIFFAATIPTALSAVYKEIAFRSVGDMDVWYLNGWVALPQFVIGLLYAPLAASITGLAIDQIPNNIWEGYRCWILGTNFIELDYGIPCSISNDCGLSTVCCDSCDGSIPSVSSLPGLYAVLLYMACNIAYNVFLILVIKHGSAALMYAASTVVLPLGTAAFTISAFLGQHAQNFDMYNGIGLGVVIFGLLIYRFMDSLIQKIRKRNSSKMLIQ